MANMASDNGDSAPRELALREKVFIGGVGALVPALVTYPIEDYMEFLLDPNQTAFALGFLVRLAFLFVIGGFWVYLHKTEHDPMKVFQLGIVAPAMILGIVNANNVTTETTGQPPSDGQGFRTGWSITSTAYAQPAGATGQGQTITTGNTSHYVGNGRWDWTVFVQAPPETKKKIRCVEYTLHPTFTNPVRTVCNTKDPRYPFGLSTNGWGTFQIKIKVELADGTKVPFEHQLTFKAAEPKSFLRGIFGPTKRR